MVEVLGRTKLRREDAMLSRNPFSGLCSSTAHGCLKVRVRESPLRFHQSQGAVESMNKFIAGQVRSLLADTRARLPDEKLDVNHNLFPWKVPSSPRNFRYGPRTVKRLFNLNLEVDVNLCLLRCGWTPKSPPREALSTQHHKPCFKYMLQVVSHLFTNAHSCRPPVRVTSF